MRIIATLHNRRGDPLLLLRLLRNLQLEEKIRSIGVVWSVPSGMVEPGRDELVEEEGHVQETLRRCVRMVHESGLSWEARSFLGRCYRSFQYEFMVSLNLKRRSPGMRIMLLDDPGVQDSRYGEVGNPREFLAELASHSAEDQVQVLRSRYEKYRTAYEDLQVYRMMIHSPDSALLEIPAQLVGLRSREEHILATIEDFKPDVVLLRLVHCQTELPRQSKSFDKDEPFMARKIALMGSVMKLLDAEGIVGPLPSRD